MSIKPRWSKEANDDAERLINSNAYTLDVGGKTMRYMTKDFVITQYMMTKNNAGLKDINKVRPKYVV